MHPGNSTKSRKNALFFFFVLVGLLVNNHWLQAQSFPAGFTQVLVTKGINKPTTMAFAPDGRIFVAQQRGEVRIVKNGELLPNYFMDLSVNSNGERGLIGLALDPDFTNNQYLYAYYTLADASRNRISRFTANGDEVVPGSEVVLLNLDTLSTAVNHNGGALHFGKDGKLFVAIGDNNRSANSQSLDIYHGKILRINTDGSVPNGNPFKTGSSQRKRVWAYGLRNPYTFSIQPRTGKIFVNDVGQVTWEEINDATTGGKNFGWPITEGFSINPDYANPVYAYPHADTDGTGCAISGGVFFNPTNTNYPATYWGNYFFQDLCNNWINVLDLSGSTPVRKPFATGLNTNSLGISVGNDGNLYYLQRNSSALYKIIYTTNAAPKVVQQPTSVTVSAGQPTTFQVVATGTPTLTYQWQKNGANIPGATGPSYTIARTTMANAGNYRVIVKNKVGSAISNLATLKVTPFNNAPVAVINTPANNFFYHAGDTIRFAGSATDAEDGTLPARNFSWFVNFHHDTHVHDGPPIADGVRNGSFVIPTSGEVAANVWYRIYAVVKDSKGLTDTVYRDIHPYLSTIALATQPAGLKVTLDGQPVTAPLSVSSVEGIERTIGPVSPQTLNGKTYVFAKWLHSEPANQTIATPRNNVTYTAVYQEKFDPVQLEAEKALLQGVQVASIQAGYAGTGYADYINAAGDYVEWTVNVPRAGKYQLNFRYALASGSRNLRVQVNNTVAAEALNFTSTGAWTSWSNKNLEINLNGGLNKIRATSTGTSGPNIDYLLVSQNTSTLELTTQEELTTPAAALQIYPNPANSYLNLVIPFIPEQEYTLQLYNNQGNLVNLKAPVTSVSGQNTIQLPLANLPAGLYVLKIMQGETRFSKVFFIQR
ncbi:PQQ-dependent sugar dehydrogenase [Adhaeribacter radiodurans]|uniref:PQQ-dependent sugar dehydrogenase n=1 Tax=Adhaeribacter radiodurans TaxID=2745197 RepID=A0A7L7L3Z2_9BACT|nr:PQQ-dependent sugar dehydrogenase [Adhaeribacter radiodurans]QMU27500.1 PQQ-dependent sugar dehydrogenase [Adhaeribacter radiodurans]